MLAGVYCDISSYDFGLLLEVSGYDEKQPQLVEHVIKRMTDFKPDPLRFDNLLDNEKREFKNFLLSEPEKLLPAYAELLLQDFKWTVEQLLAVCKRKRFFLFLDPCTKSYDMVKRILDLNVQEVEAFGKEMFRAFSIEFFIHGNTTEQVCFFIRCAVLYSEL
ncbi:hypothetical protein COOONC_04057 [Cooperia oncophora]